MSAPRSPAENNIIHGGLTATTLAEMFGMDVKEANRRMAGNVKPFGGGSGRYMLYRVRDAAPFLCDMTADPEEYIKSLTPSKLPPALQDAFWKAQNSKQRWEETRGDLWRTERVFQVVSNAFKIIRLTILMFVDTVSQRTELTPEQRAIVQELGDGLLASLEKGLHDEFELYNAPSDEHGMPLIDDVPLFGTGDDGSDYDDTEELEWRRQERDAA